MGGHVLIEVDNKLIAFDLRVRKIHIFPRTKGENFNAAFYLKDSHTWRAETVDDRITSIEFPINEIQYKELADIIDSVYLEPPYDYAFFGMRCTSAAAEILGKAGIIENLSRFQNIIIAFYPAQLRQTILKISERRKLHVSKKEGNSCRNFDK